MEIKPIFTDDSAQSLSHYGVKGMKWRHHLRSSINSEMNTYGMSATNTKRDNDKVLVKDAKSNAKAFVNTKKQGTSKYANLTGVSMHVKSATYGARLSKLGSAKTSTAINRGKNTVRKVFSKYGKRYGK